MTEHLITTLIGTLSPSALPIVVVVVAGLFFYYKFKSIEHDRNITKANREADSQNIHDDILKLKFRVTTLEGNNTHHEAVLNDLREQISILTSNIAKLSAQIEMMCDNLKK